MKKLYLIILMLISLGVMTACQEAPTEEPPAIPGVTTTLQPPDNIITQTPRFTATLTPSMTYTPSLTPTPSLSPTPPTYTATPTPTLTPTMAGLVAGGTNDVRRVREGPGTDGFEVVLTLSGGDEIGILGYVVNDDDEVWYKISFIDEDGTEVQGWIRSDLIDNLGDEVPRIQDTATPTLTPTFAASEDGSGTDQSPTPQGTPDPADLSDVNIRAADGNRGCKTISNNTPTVTTIQTVSIFWSWWVTLPQYMQDHLNTVTYEVKLDGEILEDWRDNRTQPFRDPNEGSNWTVYWYVPVGELSAGVHELEYRVTWSEQITDGEANYGPDTPIEEQIGSCTFTVIQAP
ncbi:MAG: SH3 domain-containing protein [Anaerolineales bacterium]|nr:SH3 domain-containing protein [Anaerolineales bacterium]